MNLKKIVLSVFIASSFWGVAQAQSGADALLFSQDNNGGTARFKGLGNAQTALGGDISSITGNPAGLGFFGRSDVSVTFNYLQNTNKTAFGDKNTNSTKGNFGVDNAGVVFHFPSIKDGSLDQGILNFNVGLSYDKTQNYNNRLKYNGVNNTSTIAHAYTDEMTDDYPNFRDDFYNSYIVEEFANPVDGFFPIASERGVKDQYNEVIQRGNKSKTALAFGANYSNKLYFGLSLGITTFQYERTSQFVETGLTKSADEIAADNPNSTIVDPSHADNDFVNAYYNITDNYFQRTEGSGLDLKFGAIYKPSTDWNLGLTIALPTWATVQDYTENPIYVNHYDTKESTTAFHSYESALYDSSWDYQMRTPWKFAAGITKFFGRGLLTADAEYIDYSTTHFYSTVDLPSNYDNVNADIKDSYKGVVNLRVGGELLINNILSARAGVNYFGNPYQHVDYTNYNGSLGLGVKLNASMYMDLAVVHQVNSYKENPYRIDETFWGIASPVAAIDHNRTNAVLTLGAKF